jgi:hypothetical protein
LKIHNHNDKKYSNYSKLLLIFCLKNKIKFPGRLDPLKRIFLIGTAYCKSDAVNLAPCGINHFVRFRELGKKSFTFRERLQSGHPLMISEDEYDKLRYDKYDVAAVGWS